jgi:protein-L-isoaspartate(D-aspartate) O-methyltransferase
MADHALARANMVENQLRPSRIEDPAVLAAMGAVPRERYVPEPLRGVAYGDDDLALGDGRYLIEPLALAKLLQAAEPSSRDLALLVGDVTGYVAAVLTRMVGSVVSLVPPGARPLLPEEGADRLVIEEGSPERGVPERAPFDLILLTGAVPELPPTLLGQLGSEGRLVAVVERGRSGHVTVARKIHGALGRITPFDARIHRLPGLQRAPAFTF